MSISRRYFVVGSGCAAAFAWSRSGVAPSGPGGITVVPGAAAPEPVAQPMAMTMATPVPDAGATIADTPVPWACVGDSMTHGVVGYPESIPYFLTTQLRPAFDDLGVIAQTTPEIAARIGASRTSVSVRQNVIPASGKVVLRAFSPMIVNNTGPDIYLDGPIQRAILGTLCGVRGYIRREAMDLLPNDQVPISAFRFHRLEDGAAVACPPNSSFVPDYRDAYKRSPLVLRMGYNNRFDFDAVVADHEAVFAWSKARQNKILLLDPPSSYYDDATALAASARIRSWLVDAAPREGHAYFPIHDFVASFHAMNKIGVTPTEDDRQAIRDGRTPMSATVGDGLHYCAAMNEAVANKLGRVLKDIGYI